MTIEQKLSSIAVNNIIKSKLDLEESVTKVKSHLAPPENKDKKDPRIMFVSSFLPKKNGKIERFDNIPIIKMHGSIPSPHLFKALRRFLRACCDEVLLIKHTQLHRR